MSKISLKHSGGNVVSLNSPTNAPGAADVAFKLPNADGSDGQALGTEGAGKLRFGNVAGGSARNLVITGACLIAQRATSSTSTGYASVDRFNLYHANTGVTITQSQQSSASSDTPYTLGFRKFFRMALASAGTANANAEIGLYYNLEAQDVANSGWNHTSSTSNITLSFWFRCSTNQTFYAYLRTRDGTNYTYPFSFTASGNNAWTKITKTIPGNSNLQIDNDNERGLSISIIPFYGTDLTNNLSLDQWSAYDTANRMPDMASTWLTAGASTFDITGIQLEVGSVATDFEHRSYADEVKLCERYFQTSFEKGQAPTHGLTKYVYRMTRPFASNIVTGMGCELRTEMRATPTTIIYTTSNGSNSTTNRVSYYDGSWTSAAISIHESLNTKSIAFDGTLSSSAVLYQFNFTCESEL